jgi:hypothetical protein
MIVDRNNSVFYDLFLGTVQGSISGLVLYAISPLFVLEFLLRFADDNFIPRFNNRTEALIFDVKIFMESITKLLKDSGTSVNKSKTGIYTFYKTKLRQFSIIIGDVSIKTKNEINALGKGFDTRLCWPHQSVHAIQKSKKELNVIKLIRKFFSTKELLQLLLTSNYY